MSEREMHAHTHALSLSLCLVWRFLAIHYYNTLGLTYLTKYITTKSITWMIYDKVSMFFNVHWPNALTKFSNTEQNKYKRCSANFNWVNNQFRVVDVTWELRRKSANMKITEARRIANAHTINQFRVVDVMSDVRRNSATFYCSVCCLNDSIQNFKRLHADAERLRDAGMLIKSRAQQVSR